MQLSPFGLLLLNPPLFTDMVNVTDQKSSYFGMATVSG